MRIAGCDAPELRQKDGARVARAVRALLIQEEVALERQRIDRYGRVAAWVTMTDGRDVAEVIVAGGWAWAEPRYAREPLEMMQKEGRARAAGLGIWKDGIPEPPWTWRRRFRKSERWGRRSNHARLRRKC